MPDGIQQYVPVGRMEPVNHDVAERLSVKAWVRFTDVQGRIEAADARIKELEGQINAFTSQDLGVRISRQERMAEAMARSQDDDCFHRDADDGKDADSRGYFRLLALAADEALYRSVGKDQEG